LETKPLNKIALYINWSPVTDATFHLSKELDTSAVFAQTTTCALNVKLTMFTATLCSKSEDKNKHPDLFVLLIRTSKTSLLKRMKALSTKRLLKRKFFTKPDS